MTEVKRRYDATRRRDGAAARRRRIVEAAQELFERDGFPRTTVTAVARRAGVSTESIYKAFGSKPGLAKAVFDFAIAGDDGTAPISERAHADAVRAEPDGRRKIGLYVDGFVERQHRSAGVQLLIRDASLVDDTAAAVWNELLEERLAGMGMLARHLHDSVPLRSDLRRGETRDVLWTYTAIEQYELLVRSRRWSLDRYRTWIARAICAAIL